MSSVLIVGVAAVEVERMLGAGIGPECPPGARCPRCGGQLDGCWRGYRRAVRFGRRVVRLWIGRSVCRGCGRTHALLPSFVVPRRLDAAPVIGAALEGAAGGLAQLGGAHIGKDEGRARTLCSALGLRGQGPAAARC